MFKKFLRIVSIICLGVFGLTFGTSSTLMAMNNEKDAQEKAKTAEERKRTRELFEEYRDKLERDHGPTHWETGSQSYTGESRTNLGDNPAHCDECETHAVYTNIINENRDENCILQ